MKVTQYQLGNDKDLYFNSAHLTDKDQADGSLVLPPSLHQFSFLLVLKATFKELQGKE